MDANLAAPEVAPRPPRFPYSNWGPWVAILGVLLALGIGIVFSIPAALFTQEHGGVERLDPPAYSAGSELDPEESTAVAVDGADGTVYSDRGTEVVAFSAAGKPLAGSTFGAFEASRGVAVDAISGRVFASDREAAEIFAYRRLGEAPPALEARFGADGLPARLAADFEPEDLAVDRAAPGAGLYVLDRGNDTVLRLSASGSYGGLLDPAETPAGEFGFEGENGLAVDPGSGRVYVAAEGEDGGTVWAFDRRGDLLWEMSREEGACGVAVGPGGNLWVASPRGEAAEYALGARASEEPTATGETATADRHSCELAFGPGGALFAARDVAGELSTVGSILVQLATALGFLLVPMAIASRWGAASLGQILARLGVRRFKLSALKWMAAAIGAYLLFAALYVALVVEPKQEDIAEGFGALPVQVLLIVFVASISEEVCFRGMLFGGLRERLPRYAAALLAGTIFGGLHALTGITAVPPLIFFGFVLALLYERTGSIVPGILLHMLNNSVALLAQ